MLAALTGRGRLLLPSKTKKYCIPLPAETSKKTQYSNYSDPLADFLNPGQAALADLASPITVPFPVPETYRTV
jgi:hypothetical protein